MLSRRSALPQEEPCKYSTPCWEAHPVSGRYTCCLKALSSCGGTWIYVNFFMLSLQCGINCQGVACVLISAIVVSLEVVCTLNVGGDLLIMVWLEVVCTLGTNRHLRLVLKPRRNENNQLHIFHLSLVSHTDMRMEGGDRACCIN